MLLNKIISFFLILSILASYKNLSGQEIKIHEVDEASYPVIHVILEFPGEQKVDFHSIKILEMKDTLVFSIDSMPDSGNNKSIAVLVGQEIMNHNESFEKSLNLIKDITSLLSYEDRFNILISLHYKDAEECFFPISYEFSNDYKGMLEYFKIHRKSFLKQDKFYINACSVEKTIDFFTAKKNIPSKKLICILTNYDENQFDSLPAIKRKAQENGIILTWFRIISDQSVSSSSSSQDVQAIAERFDSVFSEKYPGSHINKKLYILSFKTKQNDALNQFEIEYKNVKLRSTFSKPDYLSFFRKNALLIGIIAFFLLLIIFFIINLIYTKRQMMQSARDLKIRYNKPLSPGMMETDNFSSKKTLYGTNTITPFLSIEIEGKVVTRELTKLVTTIGRSEQNDIVIDNLTISTFHASIQFESGKFIITDNASTNGTFVNETKITKCPIYNNDIIRLGKARIILTC